jgi:hypothetical protein
VLSLLYLHGLSSKDFVPARAIPGHHRAPDSGILLVLDVLRADEKSILSGPRARPPVRGRAYTSIAPG